MTSLLQRIETEYYDIASASNFLLPTRQHLRMVSTSSSGGIFISSRYSTSCLLRNELIGIGGITEGVPPRVTNSGDITDTCCKKCYLNLLCCFYKLPIECFDETSAILFIYGEYLLGIQISRKLQKNCLIVSSFKTRRLRF